MEPLVLAGILGYRNLLGALLHRYPDALLIIDDVWDEGASASALSVVSEIIQMQELNELPAQVNPTVGATGWGWVFAAGRFACFACHHRA